MIIEVLVKTKQKKSSVTKLKDGTYKIYIKSSPIENKANTEVKKLLSEYFDIPQNSITIKLGKKSSKKIMQINY